MRSSIYAPANPADLLQDTPEIPRIALPQGKAAKALGVSDRTLRNWEKAGLLTGSRVGGIKLYPIEQLRKLAGIGPQQSLP